MTGRWVILGATAWVFSATALAGCTQVTDAPSDDAGTSIQQGIIGGELAGDTYRAVGAIVIESPPPFPSISVLCSATLIDSGAVLTARHCTPAMANAEAAGLDVRFAIGQIAYAPDQDIPITGWVTATPPSPYNGLLQDGGRDVAVAYLQHPPAQVPPVHLGTFSTDLIGTQFTIVGYGRDENNFAGLRYAGPATARSLGGTWYPLLFDGNYGMYRQWYFEDAATSDPNNAEALAWWGGFELEPGFELLAAGLEGEALGCFGDSGGPLLLGDSADNLTLYGVNFATEASKSKICDLGNAYTVTNSTILDFVNGAL